MSSTRTSPTVQPTGSMMLNRITTITVNAAWPAAKDTASGRKAATTHDERQHRPQVPWRGPRPTGPARRRSKNPTNVPISARSAVDPVVSAEERSTDMAASTTQKPWAISVTSASSTAMERPSAPRTLFWNQTDRRVM